jgi:hypothetical protein
MTERDYIEELISKNIEVLNDNEPLEGHFDRFEAKLKLQHKTKKVNFRMVLKIAAAVVFVFLAVNQAAIYFSPDYNGKLFAGFNKNEVTLASVSPEYGEVEFYYTNAINVGLNQWDELNSEGLISAEEKELMDKELTEFEERFKNLQQDLAANPSDERVINAMLEYYQAKLSIINMIVDKLQEVKQQKNSENERTMAI